MAQTKSNTPTGQDETRAVPNEDVQPTQVQPAADRPKRELKADVVNKEDLDKGVLDEPEHAADRTSIPGPEYPPADRPPVATTRFDEPIIQSLVLGAGAHEPPDPDVYDPEGRIREGK